MAWARGISTAAVLFACWACSRASECGDDEVCSDELTLMQQLRKSHTESDMKVGNCLSSTEGTCSMWGCDGSRNAQCEGGKCVCKSGQCARDGKCLDFGFNAGYKCTVGEQVGGN